MLRRSGVAVLGIVELIDWRPDVVFQVGIGAHWQEVDVMREAWPGVDFVGCEPHPGLAEGLRKEYPGEFYNHAIGDKKGMVALHSRFKHKDGATLFKRQEDKEGDEMFWVPITTLDLFFPDPEAYGMQILLWLDCEGSELAALRGGTEFLKSVDVVNVEMTNKPPGRGWCTVLDTHCCLVRNGFVRQSSHTNRSAGGQCDAVYVKERLFKPEFCSCPISLIPKECYLEDCK